MTKLTHLNEAGEAHMVDISAKPPTSRAARATGRVNMSSDTLKALRAGALKKGDALAAARLAGIMAAKQTAALIPLCHPIALTSVDVALTPREDAPPHIAVTATARCHGATGVEMEALVAVSAACLTLYDMAKAVDREMTITDIRLEEKSGGRSGTWRRET